MKNSFFKTILILGLIFRLGIINAQTSNHYSSLIKECEDFILQKMESDKIVGVSAAIILDDSVIWKKGFGYSDMENKVLMTENTIFPIASITKTFTTLGIMQLQEKGLIDINQPLRKYLPQFKPKTQGWDLNEVTIKSIITHTSGIQSDIFINSDLSTGKYTDVVDFINDTYLAFPPGMVGLYSNSGYNILGHLIKEVSKQDYPDYIHKNIFAPLGMDNTGFTMDTLKNRTKIYSGCNEIKEYELRDIASGGIYSNINDLIKYSKGLIDAYNGEKSSIIKTETVHQMFTLQNKNVPIETNKKGLGWFMFKNDSAFAMFHSGSGGFAHAKLLLIPEKKVAVMIMTNTTEGGSMADEFCINFLNKYQLSIPDLFPPQIIKGINKKTEPIILPIEILAKHEGDYAQPNSYLTISIENSNLKMIQDNKQYILKALSDNEFIPIEIVGKDSTVQKDNERYCFTDIRGYHFLFHKVGNSEYQLGYKMNKTDSSLWSKRIGVYEHFGYQMLIGDSKFKGVELYLSENRVLTLKIITYDSQMPVALDVISDKYAITCGINACFGGSYTIKFTENEKYEIIDFAGITFRKEKTK